MMRKAQRVVFENRRKNKNCFDPLLFPYKGALGLSHPVLPSGFCNCFCSPASVHTVPPTQKVFFAMLTAQSPTRSSTLASYDTFLSNLHLPFASPPP